jgi:hypothetical protein
VSKHKRQAFFQEGVRAFQNLTADQREIYFCPLCKRGFSRKALEAKVLTLEHVPPRSLGGKELLLTCKKCNSIAGHTVDSAVHARERQQEFFKALVSRTGKFEGDIKLKMGDETLNFVLVADGESRLVQLRPRGNDPKAIKRLQDELERYVVEKTWNRQKFNVSPVRGFHQWQSKVGDLRIAYLLAFAAFGYFYAFNERLDPIREQLAEPEQRKLEGFWRFLGWGQLQRRTMAIVTEPIELLYVCLGNSVVLLPWIAGPDNLYSEITTNFAEGQKANFSGKEVPWPDRLRLELDYMGWNIQFTNRNSCASKAH